MSANTATGAGNKNTYTIIFKNRQHMDYYREFIYFWEAVNLRYPEYIC